MNDKLEGDDMEKTGSIVSFDTSNLRYEIPDELEINPDEIRDNKNGVLRISLGRANFTEEEQEQYKKVFRALNQRIRDKPFVDGLSFFVGEYELFFDMAYVSKTKNQYGVFYDIEAIEEDTVYRKRTKDAKS